MKTIIIGFSLLALLIANLSCKKTGSTPGDGGAPIAPRLSYDLVDGAGTTSWFALPGNTLPDSVRFQGTYANGTTQRYRPQLFPSRSRIYLKDVGFGFSNSNVVVAPDGTSYTSTLLVYLNRQDVDTLRTEVYHDTAPNSAVIKQLRFYYNNRLSASYDFPTTRGFNDSLYFNDPIGLVVPLHKYRH